MIFYNKIFFGSECNNRCVGCQVVDDVTSQTMDDFVRQVDALDDFENLALSGGEPTLASDLISLVSHVRTLGAKRVRLITNGRRLRDMDFLANLVEAGCRLFEVKIEGSRPDVHDAVTGVRGSFDETLQGLENLGALAGHEDAIFVAARVGVTKTNLSDVVSIVSMLTSFGVDRIILARRSSDFSLKQGSFVVANTLKVATLNRTWAQCEGFPPCLMAGSERHVAECLEPKHHPGKKPKGCQKCDYEFFCSGPPEDYVAERGSKEFRAVSSSPYIEDMKRLHAMRFPHGQT